MDNSYYEKQVKLLLSVLPFIAEQKCFALKGGTAINLFIRDMPRISVDIDLTYLPIEDRQISHQGIHNALLSIAGKVKTLNKVTAQYHTPHQSPFISRLHISNEEAYIKVEPNLVLRGSVYPCREYDLVQAAQDCFGEFVSLTGLSLADIYAGKICAALDRQHPRDLFDIKLLFENEGINDEIRKAFVVYLVSGNRPMNELLEPNCLDVSELFQRELLGMTSKPVAYEELLQARVDLIAFLKRALTEEERLFILSIAKGAPEWDRIEFKKVKDLPAVKWKLINVRKMDSKKQQLAVKELQNVLGL